MAVLGLGSIYSPEASAEIVTLVLEPGGDPTNPLATPWAVAADPCGNLNVTSVNNNAALRIAPDGTTSVILDSSGDGVHPLRMPEGIETDATCNIFVTGRLSSNVFKVEPVGTITQIIDSSGDGVNPLSIIGGVSTSTWGDVFVTGSASNNVFRIQPDGTIDQILDGSGDGVNGLERPTGIETDNAGNVYVVGSMSQNAFQIAMDGTATEIIDATGDGTNPLSQPVDVAADPFGNVYVTGRYSDNVFKVSANGTITQVLDASGDGTVPMSRPVVVKVDTSGAAYVTASGSDNVFRITSDGSVSQIIDRAGDGINPLISPIGATLAPDNSAFVAGINSANIFRILPSGSVSEYAAGSGLNDPSTVATDRSGNAFVAGKFSNNVIKIAADGTVIELVGPEGDGINPLTSPSDVATDWQGNVYVTGRISENLFRVHPDGSMHQILDTTGDGINPLFMPAHVAVDGSGNAYVAGQLSDNVFRVRPNGDIREILNSFGDGTHAFSNPGALAVDRFANVYVAGKSNNNVFRVSPDGSINQVLDATGGGVAALAAPSALLADDAGNLYVAGRGSDNVLRLDLQGTVTQVIDGSGDGINALNHPLALALDELGNLYVLGGRSANLFRISPGGNITQILDGSGDGTNGFKGAGDVAVDADHRAYVTDSLNNHVLRVAPDILLGLTAESPFMQQGSPLAISLVIENSSDQMQSITTALRLALPNGSAVTLGTFPVTLQGNESKVQALPLALPASAPDGVYTLIVLAVRSGALVVGRDELTFEKVSAASIGPTFVELTDFAGLNFSQLPQAQTPDCLQPPIPGASDGFECIQESVSGGVAAGDYDQDGRVDLYVTRPYESDILFRNLGDGTFEDTTVTAGLDQLIQSNGALWADIDNDSDLDLYVNTLGETRNFLFINDGSGQFTEEAVPRGAALETIYPHWGMGLAAGDYDRDGWIDLYATEWIADTTPPSGIPSHSRLLRNLGGGQFEDVTESAGVVLDGAPGTTLYPVPAGVFSFSPAFVDLDSDGWQDLVVTGDHGTSHLFWNQADGTFIEGTAAAGVATGTTEMGSSFGDYDQDGDLDWFVTAISCEAPFARGTFDCSGNRLYRNEGNRMFSDQTDSAGVRVGHWGWGTVFFDFDNDGDLDIVMTNGMEVTPPISDDDPYNLDPMRFWRNLGDGTMTERSALIGLDDTGDGKGLITFDYDGDGDLDLFLLNTGGPPILYENQDGNLNDFLRVEIVGTTSNRQGLGARITVTPEEGAKTQVREVGARSHFLGQSETTEHFGLGSGGNPVFEVRVFWPATDIEQIFSNVPRNTTLTVAEP